MPSVVSAGRRSIQGSAGVTDANQENKERNREIAQNEAERQTTGDVRVSVWAIAAAVVISLAAFGWVMIHNGH
jgi:hypothetical protein